MTRISIFRVEISNFKGCRALVIQPDGAPIHIMGRNGAGKTTVGDAITWCLTGYDLEGRADHGIKPLDSANKEIHNLETSVFLGLSVNGLPRTFRRVYYEKWQKKRGAHTPEFTGHTTDYYVDDVPRQKKEYDAAISELFTPDQFAMLSNPDAFNVDLPQWGWRNRREVLLAVIGGVSDAEVISSNPRLSPLAEIIKTKSIEDYSLQLFNQSKIENQKLKEYPIRIAEAERMTATPAAPEGDRVAMDRRRAELEDAIATLRSSGDDARRRRRIAEIDARLAELDNTGRARARQERLSLQSQLDAHARELHAAEEALGNRVAKRLQLTISADRLAQALDALRAEFKAITAERYEVTVSDICPVCNQSLPPDRVEAARAEALAHYNAQRARRLADNKSAGRAKKAEHDALIAAIAEIDASPTVDMDPIRARIDGVHARLDALPEITPSQEETDETAALLTERDTLLTTSAVDTSGEMDRLTSDLASIAGNIRAWDEYLAARKASQTAQERVSELQQAQRDAGARYEEIEALRGLCDDFIRIRAAMLSERVNERFTTISFKLFKVLVNGGLEECCEALVRSSQGNLVEYRKASTGERIRAGLEVIAVLSEHYGLSLPVIVDHYESITPPLPELPAQYITLEHRADRACDHCDGAGTEDGDTACIVCDGTGRVPLDNTLTITTGV